MSIESQLAAYRAKKAKEKNNQPASSGIFGLLSRRTNTDNTMTSEVEMNTDPASSNSQSVQVNSVHQIEGGNNRVLKRFDFLFRKSYVLKFILWLILFGLFVELEFGSVYFIASFFYIIYATLRTDPNKDGQLSAYSVFNPNQERLDGTFTAEQFEKELRYGAGSVGRD